MDKKKTIIKTLKGCSDIGNNAEGHYEGLKKLANKFAADDQITKYSVLLSALANRYRLLIVHLLREKDRCLCELEAATARSQPSVSRHIKVLETAALIRGWKKGKFTHYSLIKKNFEFFCEFTQEMFGDMSNWFGSL